jgi:hypothetical protein
MHVIFLPQALCDINQNIIYLLEETKELLNNFTMHKIHLGLVVFIHTV